MSIENSRQITREIVKVCETENLNVSGIYRP